MPITFDNEEDLPGGDNLRRMIDPLIALAIRPDPPTAFVKVLCCSACNLPHCTGIQIIDTVVTVDGVPRANYFLVRAVTNIDLEEERNVNIPPVPIIILAEMDHHMCSIAHRIVCKCGRIAGYKLLLVERGAMPLTAQSGQYIVIGRLHDEVP